MPPFLEAGATSSANTNIMPSSTTLVTSMYLLAAWNCLLVNSEWVKTKIRFALAPRRTIFASTFTKTTPQSLLFFGRLGYLSRIGLLGWTNFDITDATAPTPERSFGNLGNILTKSVKERMGWWEGWCGTFLYLGVRRVSKIKNTQPGLWAKSQNSLAKICIKEPFTIAPMKLHRSAATQLVKLKV